MPENKAPYYDVETIPQQFGKVLRGVSNSYPWTVASGSVMAIGYGLFASLNGSSAYGGGSTAVIVTSIAGVAGGIVTAVSGNSTQRQKNAILIEKMRLESERFRMESDEKERDRKHSEMVMIHESQQAESERKYKQDKDDLDRNERMLDLKGKMTALSLELIDVRRQNVELKDLLNELIKEHDINIKKNQAMIEEMIEKRKSDSSIIPPDVEGPPPNDDDTPLSDVPV